MTAFEASFPLVMKRGIRRGVLNVWRERGWMTTLAALIGITLLAQLFLVVTFGVEGLEQLLRQQADLRLEVKSDANDQQVQEFFAAVGQLPYVEDAIYITREQAYERTRRRDPSLVAFLEEFQIENPFPDTIGITLTSLDDYERFRLFAQEPRWQAVIDPTFMSSATEQEAQVHELLDVAAAGRAIAYFFLMIAGILLLFVLTDLVRRRSLLRSEEIVVERLVGARHLAVLLPFVTEAALLLFAALCLSAALVGVLLYMLPSLIPALSSDGVFGGLHTEVAILLRHALPFLIVFELLLVPLLALFGAWIGMRPLLKSPRLSLARL